MRLISFIVCSLLCYLLTACSMWLPTGATAPNRYTIKASVSPVGEKSSRDISIIVPAMEADTLYRTTLIAYTTKPYQIAYFAKNTWAEKPDTMLHVALVEYLQNTHYFQAVNTALSINNDDYILNTQLLELYQDFTRHPSILHLKIQAQLISAASKRVSASKVFSISISAFEDTPYGGVVAANRAANVLLKQIAIFCITNSK